MAVIGRAVPAHESAPYVFFDEGEELGTAQRVVGLDAAVEAMGRRDGLVNIPDIVMTGMDEAMLDWSRARAKRPHEKWNFIVRDNRRKRWVELQGAWVDDRGNLSSSCTWIVDSVRRADGPM